MSVDGPTAERGRLRVYLGAAPGVGKTYAALEEAHVLRDRGHDVVVGFVETHGRSDTAAKVGDLEVVPRQTVSYRGSPFEEMDLAAVLARAPETVLVDELAHTNVPGVRNVKRWEDVETLLAAGIDVISTLNIQHLESLNDVVAEITGVVQRETIPDEVVRQADELELVDLTQEGVRDRLATGKIYPAERIDAALANFFRPGNLGALRELALSWTADRVDEAVERYRRVQGIAEPWETRERIVVGITGAAGGDTAIRRASRIAMRARGELLGVHVRGLTGLRSEAPELAAQQALLSELGGTYLEVSGERLGEALVDVARTHNATQLVIGASRRSRWQELTQGSIVREVLRTAGPLDVHVISNIEPHADTIPRLRPGALPLRRTLAGWALVGVLVPLATMVMLDHRDSIGLDDVLLVYLVLAVAAAWVGGAWPALAASVAGFLLANRLFTPPFDTWLIQRGSDLFALAVFVVLGVGSGLLVSRAARRTAEAAVAQAEASTLIDLFTTSSNDGLDASADRVRQAIGADGLSLFATEGPLWRRLATAGPRPPADAFGADRIEADGSIVLALNGGMSTPAEERIIKVYLVQVRNRITRERLEAEAAEVGALTQADGLRTSLLRAVSHDLRSPLAAIKASATSLLAGDVRWSDEETTEFVEAIEAETGRMERIVSDLLDAGRLQAGGVAVALRPVALEDVVAAGVTGLGTDLDRVDIDIDETLPLVVTDPGLLERIIENLVRNAVAFSPSDRRVSVSAGRVNDHVDLRVVDHGPGISPSEQARVFQPFQRLGDTTRPGIGLGLAVARGLADVLGHELVVDDTPGGGATMVVRMAVGT